MRNYRLTLILAVLASFTAFYACNKYKDTLPPSNELPEDKVVTASVQGRVLDEKGVPMQGVTVTSGTASTTTDVNGTFFFTDISLYSRFGFVNVAKQGYFTGSRTFVTSTSALNFVEIHMLPRTSSGSFDASAGGTVNVSGGQSVVFTGGTIVYAATNAVYSGNVNVYATYLDPTDKATLTTMPGDMRGVMTDKKEMSFRSYGMMNVEMESDGGEKLQIAPGKTADLSLAIPAALQAGAADTIPMWHFNDTTGKWMQEGKADKKGNTYVGKVGHFSWWNDGGFINSGCIWLTMRFVDQNGNPLANTNVYLYINPDTYAWNLGITDSSGTVKEMMPTGTIYQAKVTDRCGKMIGGVNVGPLWRDADWGTVTVTMTEPVLSLSGNVVDCSNSPVDIGSVNVYIDNLTYRAAVSNGKFSLNILRCNGASTQAQIIAVDNGTSQQGSMNSFTVKSGSVDVGDISACGVTLNEFINVTFNGNTYSFTNPPDQFSYSSPSFFEATSTNPDYKLVSFYLYNNPLSGTGTYTPMHFLFYASGISAGAGGAHPMNVNVSQFGPVNGFITGTLTGEITDSTANQVYPLTGSFKIKRAN